jgi:hypothetical protein
MAYAANDESFKFISFSRFLVYIGYLKVTYQYDWFIVKKITIPTTDTYFCTKFLLTDG